MERHEILDDLAADVVNRILKQETAIAELQKSGTLTETVVIDPDEFQPCSASHADASSANTTEPADTCVRIIVTASSSDRNTAVSVRPLRIFMRASFV
jgi:hypothetical protein